MFTTVHPVGQWSESLCIVASVPSAAGHLNVPEDATLKSHTAVELDHVENATSISDKEVQSLNMYQQQFPTRVVAEITGAVVRDEQPLNMLL